MWYNTNMEIDIKIDELTNCLIEQLTGNKCDTEYKLIKNIDSKMAKEMMSIGWNFDWSKPQEKGYMVYALYIKDSDEIEGLIALKHIKEELYTHVDIVESAPHNIGKNGKYKGVGAHLFAIACKESWDIGNEGYVQFTAKNGLIEHYKETLKAKNIDWHIMYIDSYGALDLIKKYFSEV